MASLTINPTAEATVIELDSTATVDFYSDRENRSQPPFTAENVPLALATSISLTALANGSPSWGQRDLTITYSAGSPFVAKLDGSSILTFKGVARNSATVKLPGRHVYTKPFSEIISLSIA